MKKRLVLIILSILLLSTFNGFILATPILEKVTTFSDDTSEKVFSFPPGGGTDQSAYFEVPKKAIITNASFDVCTVFNSGGNYPNKPRIDVGNDGDYEWAFDGKGYGDYGKQNVFSDDQISPEISFNVTKSYDNDTYILLPKNATVTSATMHVASNNIKNIGKNYCEK